MSEKSQCIPELRAIFAWLSDVMRSCFSFALLRSVIGPEISHHSLNQSDPKLKPITTWLRAVACFYFELLLIGPWDFLGFGFCDTRSKTAPRELTSVYEHQAIRKTVTPRDRMFSVTGYWPTCWRFMHNNWLLTFYTCGGDRLSVWK